MQTLSSVLNSKNRSIFGKLLLKGKHFMMDKPEVTFNKCTLIDGDLSKTTLKRYTLDSVLLDHINLSEVHLDDCALHNVKCTECNMGGITFTNCRGYGNLPQEWRQALQKDGNSYKETPDTADVIIGSDDQEEVEFIKVWDALWTISGEMSADCSGYDIVDWFQFKNCIFKKGYLNHVDFYDCDFRNTKFEGVEMLSVTFTNCTFEEVLCIGCTMDGIRYKKCTGELQIQ